jgi:hypothetical protein
MPPDPKQSNGFVPFNMPNPPQGKFAAVAGAPGPGMQLLYRDINLEGPMMLELTLFYANGDDGLTNYSGPFVTPRTLAINAGPNQQVRVDILAPTAGHSCFEPAKAASFFEAHLAKPWRTYQ